MHKTTREDESAGSAGLRESERDPTVGQTLGSYHIERKLGEGGMGAVYLGRHTLLGRAAAVKVLLPSYTNDAEVVGRFFNEAKAVSLIRHPGIVEIFDFGYHSDGSAFIVMELLEGEDLGTLLDREGALDEATVCAIGRQIASAVGAAHDKGVIHRDLKPENIFLVKDLETMLGFRVKVLDFGIAKLGGGEASPKKTRTGAIMGTPVYMSPEQCRGAGEVDWRSDVYSLGCMLFEMASGRPPFLAEGTGELIAVHMFQEPPRLRAVAPAASARLEAIVGHTLSKSPDQRPQSMAQLRAQLDGAVDPSVLVGVHGTGSRRVPKEVELLVSGRIAPKRPLDTAELEAVRATLPAGGAAEPASLAKGAEQRSGVPGGASRLDGPPAHAPQSLQETLPPVLPPLFEASSIEERSTEERASAPRTEPDGPTAPTEGSMATVRRRGATTLREATGERMAVVAEAESISRTRRRILLGGAAVATGFATAIALVIARLGAPAPLAHTSRPAEGAAVLREVAPHAAASGANGSAIVPSAAVPAGAAAPEMAEHAATRGVRPVGGQPGAGAELAAETLDRPERASGQAPPAAAEPVELRVESSPGGAEVYRVTDGVLLGRTPYTERRAPVQGAVVYLVKLKGYEDGRVELRADVNSVASLVLSRSRARSSGHGGDRKPPKDTSVQPSPSTPGVFKPF